MADLLQKMFMIFVRPYYVDQYGNKVFYKGAAYGDLKPPSGTERYPLVTNNTTGQANSPVKLNQGGTYTADPWFLHSTWGSYNQFREKLKEIVALYGTDNVKCALYVPIDFEVLPNQ